MEPYELLGLDNSTLDMISEVRTHPEVLEQCRVWLDAKFGERIKRVVVNGTGQAAKSIKELRDPTMYFLVVTLEWRLQERQPGGTIN